MVIQNKQSLRDKGFCMESNCMNSQGDLLIPNYPDSYKIVPPQNHLEYEKIYNLVDEAESVCGECGEYHYYLGRKLRPSSEALEAWIDIEVKMKKNSGGKSKCLRTKNPYFLVA